MLVYIFCVLAVTSLGSGECEEDWCDECTMIKDCGWCTKTSKCYNVSVGSPAACDNRWKIGPASCSVERVSSLQFTDATLHIVVAIVGGVLLFFGYRLFYLALIVAAVAVGGFGTYALLLQYTEWGIWIRLAFALVGAGILFGLMMCLIKFAIFVVGALLGLVLAAILLSIPPIGEQLATQQIGRGIGVAGLALVTGGLAVWLKKPVIVMATALGGSYALFTTFDYFLWAGGTVVLSGYLSLSVYRVLDALGIYSGTPPPEPNASPTFLVTIMAMFLLAGVGGYVQYKLTGEAILHPPCLKRGDKNKKPKNQDLEQPLLG